MGISGLLPLLKSIQVTKHLSEFSGQTLAVDGYGWLHRGAYACAAEIATGKPTHKYVDFAMHRVRLLRHYNIQPYIVFDGGPLPAKKGTEVERERRRQENLMRANALASQGKHNQAREFYVKCVDITPEMAYQLIKALKAESVPYVVAPYEADAQMAYLERIGLVDGVITEDSDLLVFGCKNIHLKLDVVASTVVCISRRDFASVHASDSSGISLRGWSDKEFRTMAILSGCDYLPSIPGIGLKTAWALLRKWKTVENVIRTIRLEGKKKVPKDYLDSFYMAELCFLHQRVYDPSTKRLVHLNNVEVVGWTETCDEYVGRNLDPLIAKKIAEGDFNPISYRPMRDIHPAYQPNPVMAKRLMTSDTNRKNKGKSKSPEKKFATITDFFGSKPIIPPAYKAKTLKGSPGKMPRLVGKASGKRTLVEAIELDVVAKKPRLGAAQPEKIVPSRFFHEPVTSICSSPKRQRNRATSSQVTLDDDVELTSWDEKENVCIELNVTAADLLGEEGISGPSLRPRGSEDIDLDSDNDAERKGVLQEDGYLTPSPDLGRWETPELSSPVRETQSWIGQDGDNNDFVPSPTRVKRELTQTVTQTTPQHRIPQTPCDSTIDLCECFSDSSSGEEVLEYDSAPPTTAMSPQPEPVQLMKHTSAPSVVPSTREDDRSSLASSTRHQAVVQGWRDKWAFNGTLARRQDFVPLRRRETTADSRGRERSQLCTVPRLSLSRVTPVLSCQRKSSLAKSHSHSDGEGPCGKVNLSIPLGIHTTDDSDSQVGSQSK